MRMLRKLAKAEARVAALTEESTALALRRSQAETALAQSEVHRLRAELDALSVRYAALERRLTAEQIAS
ncbi:hypothetical protein GCM10009547_30320 [Sporichthya brevicatena]|uniref:Uncharacterized protein n=1 Tax=Sporichthya brevicatena TaxID=171442 RepID=A0ABN1H0F7_9ACTN